MTTPRSNEAVQGSSKAGPELSLPEVPGHTNARVLRYIQNTSEPVNVTLALAPPSQLSIPRQRSHTELLGSIDRLFGGQHQAGDTATQSEDANRGSSVEIVNPTRDAEARSSGSYSAGKTRGTST
ncbi:hypothetical protein F4819DRAFT_488995 [Hypoxylon fuscum]|nr:hypothetical protein F4819DRAFT_488995 [Hypoxylon fuscum]